VPADASARFAVPFPIDLGLTLGPLQRGAGDPTIHFDGDQVWRAARTPEGVGALHLEVANDDVAAEAWGDGASWLLNSVPQLLGFDDRGKVRLSMKQVDQQTGEDLSKKPQPNAETQQQTG